MLLLLVRRLASMLLIMAVVSFVLFLIMFAITLLQLRVARRADA